MLRRSFRAAEADLDGVRTFVSEDDVVAWLSDRIDPAGAEALKAKLETFVVSR